MNESVRKLNNAIYNRDKHDRSNFTFEDKAIEEFLNSLKQMTKSTFDRNQLSTLHQCLLKLWKDRLSSEKDSTQLPTESIFIVLLFIYELFRNDTFWKSFEKKTTGLSQVLQNRLSYQLQQYNPNLGDVSDKQKNQNMYNVRIMHLIVQILYILINNRKTNTTNVEISVTLIQSLLTIPDDVLIQSTLVLLNYLISRKILREQVNEIKWFAGFWKLLSHHDDHVARLASSFIESMVLRHEQFRQSLSTDLEAVPTILSLIASRKEINESIKSAKTTKSLDNSTDMFTIRALPIGQHLSPVAVACAICLEKLVVYPHIPDQIRSHGGIQILMSCLRDFNKIPVDNESSATAPEFKLTESSNFSEVAYRLINLNNETDRDVIKFHASICGILAHLALDDFSAQFISRENGVYLLGCQLLFLPRSAKLLVTDSSGSRKTLCNPPDLVITPAELESSSPDTSRKRSASSARSHQSSRAVNGPSEIGCLKKLFLNVFCALRRLFVFERNRRLIKSLLPSTLLALMIEVKRTSADLTNFNLIVNHLETMDDDDRQRILKGIMSCNLNRSPTRLVREYAILELLGSGAFGQVFKARKGDCAQPLFAIKEVNTLLTMFGRSAEERKQSIGRILNEVNIIRQQLRHPNIVRYYKTFLHDDHLYIVMELLDGVSLTELVSSMRDRDEHLPESRIWHIFIQLLLALRYLHREKKILHRDLSSNNIMIGEGDKVTITDFGLARQKQWDSSGLTSAVGTLVYSCPEIVQSIPYGEGADIWSLGCILYQLCALTPPFQAENILTVASKIVKADYEPLQTKCPGHYSDLVERVIRICLNPDPATRPDIIGVASHLTNALLSELDLNCIASAQAKRRLKEFRHQISSSNYTNLFRSTSTGNLQLADSPSSRQATQIPETSQEKLCMQNTSSANQDNPNPPSLTDKPPISPTSFIRTDVTPKPLSASMVTISQRRLRLVNDPILDVASVVHKLGYLSIASPMLDPKYGPLKRLIDSYQQKLFSIGVAPLTVKNELVQLATRSCEPIGNRFMPINEPSEELENSHLQLIQTALEALRPDLGSSLSETGYVTYEIFMNILNSILERCTNYFQ